MDVQKLKQLLKQEEGEKLDFKAELHLATESEKKELVKDVTAIANSRGGRGHIIFGIEDKTKEIIGINPDDFKEEQIQQIIYSRTDPPVPVRLDIVRLDNKDVAVLTIYRSRHAPHQVISTGAFYIRRGSTTDFARRAELASIMQENGLMSFETITVTGATLEDLDFNRINEFFKSMDLAVEHPQLILMEAFGFISGKGEGYSPTIGGLLLFGKAPHMYLPQCYVKIIYNNNAETLYGNIPDLLDKATERVKNIINNSNYPINAFEEALANALVHRDYLDYSRGIYVTINKKSIEIVNPGAVSGSTRANEHSSDCVPERRNPWLYQRLVAFDERRSFLSTGVGMSRIKKSLAKFGKVKFINLPRQNSYKVILPIPGIYTV